MIDTVLLKIPAGKFIISRHDLFEPDSRGVFVPPYLPFNRLPYVKCVQNPSKKDGLYKPRLTIYKSLLRGHGFSIKLHIEFSVPKLLFGNNFDEAEESDFDQIIEILYVRLLKMGVVMDKNDLRAAPVYSVHYSKNIAFTDYTTVSSILRYLEKIKVSRRFDLNKIKYTNEYGNEGELVRFHTKSFSLVFYDKIAELMKSKDRGVEKIDRGLNLQLSFFEEVRKKTPLEIFRFEMRFNDRRKMKKVFGLELQELTFARLFNQNIARKSLLSHWQAIYDELKPVLLQDLSPLEHFELLARQKTSLSPQKVFGMMGLASILKEHGYRTVQKNFEQFYSGRTLQRMYDDIKKLNFAVLNRAPPFQKITRDLEEFKALKMNQFTL